MNDGNLKELEQEILNEIARCLKCRMCIGVCPTYEGWLTRSPAGRLMAINLHFRFGLGDRAELGEILFSCTTCRRCQEMCKMVSAGIASADAIVKARHLLVRSCRPIVKEKQNG